MAAALLPAMLRNESLEISPEIPVSPTLLENLRTLEEIFHAWNPVLRRVPISAPTTFPAEPLNVGTVTFFSGGVDSTYTLLKHQAEITHAVLIHGFDFMYANSEPYAAAVQRNASFLGHYGKSLIQAETNHHTFGYRYNLSRNLTQGSCLGAVAMLLGFPLAFVPASYSYAYLRPLGSHPLSDPLWSNEAIKIVHDGCEAQRTHKTSRICEDRLALANLRVCFTDMNDNCGACLKCLRTMVTLRLLGESAGPFPSLPPLTAISSQRIEDDQVAFLQENIDLARRVGDVALLRALLRCRRRHERRETVRQLDRVFFGGVVSQVRRVFSRPREQVPRIDATPRGGLGGPPSWPSNPRGR